MYGYGFYYDRTYILLIIGMLLSVAEALPGLPESRLQEESFRRQALQTYRCALCREVLQTIMIPEQKQ